MTSPNFSDILLPEYPADTFFLPVSSLFCEKTEVSRAGVKALTQSIEKNGFFEPLHIDNDFRVLDGAKRLAAAKSLCLDTVPVSYKGRDLSFFGLLIDKVKSDDDVFVIADILNFISNELCISRDTIAHELSLGTSSVSNKMRLSSFSEQERRIFRSYRLCERHARALLNIKGISRISAIKHIGECSLNVAQAEVYIDSVSKASDSPSPMRQFEKNLCRLCDNASASSLQNVMSRRETPDEIVFTVRIAK